MEEFLRSELGIEDLKCLGKGGSGCISEGMTYQTDKGEKLFIKFNNKPGARTMFDGEYRSLECLYAADIVHVPKPIKVIDLPEGGSALAMQHIQINGLSSQAGKLGELMARLHLQNSEIIEKSKKSENFVGKAEKLTPVTQFGFDIDTCCGFLPQNNTWQSSWPVFYAQKLKQQFDLVEKDSGDKEARELWSKLQLKLSSFFEMLDNIQPALLHGDLWGGNVGQDDDGPVIFDPASFYGHSEFDLAIAQMFGGFSTPFFEHYHKVIPRAAGFRKRSDLYKLFHYLNHWNHFGGSYRDSSLSTLHRLLK